MEESAKVEYFYIKKMNKMAAIGMIVVGVIMLLASLILAGGEGAIGCVLLALAGGYLFHKSRQPLIKLYSDRIDTTVFNSQFSDITKIDKKKSMYTLHFKNGSKKRISADVFDREPKERLMAFLDDLKSTI